MRRILVPVVYLVLGAWSAAAMAGSAATSDATDAKVWALVAEARMRLESAEISEGMQLFRQAVALAPKNQALAEEYGLALAEFGLVDEAVRQLGNVEKLSPSGEATLGMLLAQAAKDPQQLELAVVHLRRGLGASGQATQARVTLVQSLLQLGRPAEAWDALQRLLSDRPDDARLQLMAGQALRQIGKYDDAVAYLRKAAADPDAKQRATIELVETLAAAGKNREAADTLGSFLQDSGATLTGLSRWATLLARAGERTKAMEVLDEVLAKDPKFRDALLLKAILLARDGDTEGAERLYRRALANDPKDVDAELGLVRLFLDVRRFPEARKLLDGLWDQVESTKPRDEDLAQEVEQERASVELIDHDTKAARPWLDRLLASPLDRRSLALWGEYFRITHSYRDGLAWLTKARTVDDPEVKRMLTALTAEFSFASGDDARGNELLAPLLAGSQDDVLTAVGVLERQRKYAQVVASSRAALARLGDVVDLKFALAAALERSGSFDEAVPLFREIIKEDPENASALNYLGYTLADKNTNLDEALKLVQKAVDLDPTSGAYLDSLGWVYFRLGKLDLAEKELSEAVRLEPFDATVREHVGDLYMALGRGDDAAKAYRQALSFEIEEPGQKQRLEGKLATIEGNAKR